MRQRPTQPPEATRANSALDLTALTLDADHCGFEGAGHRARRIGDFGNRLAQVGAGGSRCRERFDPGPHPGAIWREGHVGSARQQLGQGHRSGERRGRQRSDLDHVIPLGGDDHVGAIHECTRRRAAAVLRHVEPTTLHRSDGVVDRRDTNGTEARGSNDDPPEPLGEHRLEQRGHHHRTGPVVAAHGQDAQRIRRGVGQRRSRPNTSWKRW